jgi:hypothetical protein
VNWRPLALSAVLTGSFWWPSRVRLSTADDSPRRPEMFGEGLISTPDDELGGTMTADGKTLYFEKSVPPHHLYILYESHWVGGKWQKPVVLPFSGRYKDTDPVLSPDEQSLLFASDRPIHRVDRHHFYIWAARKAKNGWSKPELMSGPVNDGFNQVFCPMARNGNLYFTSSRKSGNYDIFRSRLIDGKYQEAEDLGPNFNGPTINSFEAFIAPDESFLLMGSFGREDPLGSSDLYISYNQNEKFTKPQNLGPSINGRGRDYSPRLSEDGKWLLFTSERFDEPLDLALTYERFVHTSRSLYNGLGNLYRIPMEYALNSTKPQHEPIHEPMR